MIQCRAESFDLTPKPCEPMWRYGHYRFEFDVGLSKPELVKMLWVARDRNDKVLTSPANDGAACWIAGAKSGGDAE